MEDCELLMLLKNQTQHPIVIKHYDQKQLREGKGLLQLTVLNHSPSLKEVRTGTQGRNLQERIIEGCCLLARLAYVLILSRTVGPGVALPVLGIPTSFNLKNTLKAAGSVVVHTFNPSTQKAEAGR